MSAYMIAYLVIGVIFLCLIMVFVALLILPNTKYYKQKHEANQTIVNIQVDPAGNEEVYVNGIKQEMPEGKLQMKVASAGEAEPTKAGK
jgi:hypothetical protein